MKKDNSQPKIIVAPSVLAADIGSLESEIRSVGDAGADWLHLDVMDGSFVPPITFGTNVVALARRCSALPLDVHLMIREPERHIESFAASGASHLTVHQEVCPHLSRTLSQIREAGMSPGVSINPGTPAHTVFDVLDRCDLVLVMTVNPGWGGQPFMPSCVSKIEALRNEINRCNLSCRIEVDGGIDASTAKICLNAGATAFVSGTYIFGASDRTAAISALRAG